jgi:hypothetical protein
MLHLVIQCKGIGPSIDDFVQRADLLGQFLFGERHFCQFDLVNGNDFGEREHFGRFSFE